MRRKSVKDRKNLGITKKRSKTGREKQRKGPLYRLSAALTDRLHLYRDDGRNQRLNQEVRALSGGRGEAVREYYIDKIRELILIVLFVVVLCVLFLPMLYRGQRPIPKGQVPREGYGGDPLTQELLADVEGESETLLLPVTVSDRQYTLRQVSELLLEARDGFDETYLGENDAPDRIIYPLQFPSAFCEGAVKADYVFQPYGIISSDGEITGEPEETGTDVEIAVTFSCREQTIIYELMVKVFPPEQTPAQRIRRRVGEAAKEADIESVESEFLQLPLQVDGRNVDWSYPEGHEWKVILFLALLLPPAVFLLRDSRIHEKAGQRREQLELDYADLLWKLTMLFGAGLTIRGAIFRIAAGYEKGHAGSKKRYVYEELLFTCREIKDGVNEAAAYEQFGKRCDLPCYVKLGSILSQNLKKGSKGLAQLLEREALQATQQRRDLAKAMGERAGTKMLFPMILMLGVVMMILMIPAFLSM